jgi:transcriptional regulator with XRE-family HTH domain
MKTIKELRTEKGLTQLEVAYRIGVTPRGEAASTCRAVRGVVRRHRADGARRGPGGKTRRLDSA